MNKTKKGGRKRTKSHSARKKSKSRSPPHIRKVKSHRSVPSGVLIRYENKKGDNKQIPLPPPNCTRNGYDKKKGNCYTDPISLACLDLSTLVEHPTDSKRCFERKSICKWLNGRTRGEGDDPVTREAFTEHWKRQTCDRRNSETIREMARRSRQQREVQEELRRSHSEEWPEYLIPLGEAATTALAHMDLAGPARGEAVILRAQFATVALRGAVALSRIRPNTRGVHARILRLTSILYDLIPQLSEQGYAEAANTIRRLLAINAADARESLRQTVNTTALPLLHATAARSPAQPRYQDDDDDLYS